MSEKFFADLQLARRLERSEGHANRRFVEARARVSPEVGAQWIEVAGAHVLFDGVGSPLTQTFGLGLAEEIENRHLDEIEEFFYSRGSDVFHETCPIALSRPPLLGLLNQRGYQPVEVSSVLFLELPAALDVPRNPRIVVREIGPDEGETWVRVNVEGWAEQPDLGEYLYGIGEVMAAREDGALFLAEIDGEPIAAGGLCFHGGVLLLAGAATIPRARRQGAQLSLLEERLRYGHRIGCDVAMMAALPGSASQRNAERQGFRIAYTRVKWQSPRETPDQG